MAGRTPPEEDLSTCYLPTPCTLSLHAASHSFYVVYSKILPLSRGGGWGGRERGSEGLGRGDLSDTLS
jgi:hypothetical protein